MDILCYILFVILWAVFFIRIIEIERIMGYEYHTLNSFSDAIFTLILSCALSLFIYGVAYLLAYIVHFIVSIC